MLILESCLTHSISKRFIAFPHLKLKSYDVIETTMRHTFKVTTTDEEKQVKFCASNEEIALSNIPVALISTPYSRDKTMLAIVFP